MIEAIINLGAGKAQSIVIRKAIDLGYAVIGVDRNPSAEGFYFCDEKVYLSTYDHKPIVEHIETLINNYKLKGIIYRSSGPPVVTCAKLCQHFSLPGILPESAETIVNKAALFKACQKHDITVPNTIIIEHKDELSKAQLSYPAIVKPALSILGKGGVTLIKTREELLKAYDEAKKCSFNGLVLIQDYISGSDVSLMGFVQDGNLIPIALLDEINKINKKGQIYGAGFAIPSIISGTDIEHQLIKMAQIVISSFNLKNTFINLSCRMDNSNKLNLIEIHLDLGGDLILDQLIPAATDFDILKMAINGLVGKNITNPAIKFKPTAIIYSEGEGLISEKDFNIIQALDRLSLQEMIAVG